MCCVSLWLLFSFTQLKTLGTTHYGEEQKKETQNTTAMQCNSETAMKRHEKTRCGLEHMLCD